MTWKPGGWRDDPALQGPFEDVPDHLVNLLAGWVERGLRWTSTVSFLALTFRIPVTDPATFFSKARDELVRAARAQPELLLSFADALLALHDDVVRAKELEAILVMAGSAYAVRDDLSGLEMRVLPEAREVVAGAIASMPTTGSVGAHLAAAWQAAFSISPDPVKSYSEAIKAVEAAAAPIITPNDLRATLGTLIGTLASNSGTWHMVVASGSGPSIMTVIAMMRTLWEGQTSRHGGVIPTASETVESAQAAVFMATTLAQWFTSGAIHA